MNFSDDVFIPSNQKQIKIKKLNNMAKIPTRGSEEAAGYDLYATLETGVEKIIINPHETKKIGTGLAFELPKGTFLGIFPRSGLATKKGLRPANCIGVVDSDYRGEIGVGLCNLSDTSYTIKPGDRIAQLLIMKVENLPIEEVSSLDSTSRGSKGFGSTGK